MCEVKILEIRDRGTMIPAYAILAQAANAEQDFLLRRVGFNGQPSVIVSFLNGERISTADAYAWGDRTMQTAHLYIEDKFKELKDGDVVDVEFILGETQQPKQSEGIDAYDL